MFHPDFFKYVVYHYSRVKRASAEVVYYITYIKFFVKPDFEIAVDQQTKAHEQTFEGVPDSWCLQDRQPCPWSIFGSMLSNHLKMLKTMFCLSYEQNTILSYMPIFENTHQI